MDISKKILERVLLAGTGLMLLAIPFALTFEHGKYFGYLIGPEIVLFLISLFGTDQGQREMETIKTVYRNVDF